MVDTIRGPVTTIVDGDTFKMGVTHTGTSNQYDYNQIETIRIAEIDEPEIYTQAGIRSKQELDSKISGKIVRCYVQSRDVFGRVIAKIQIV